MGIREDLKIPLSMLEISFLDKLPYKGSYNGKRFMFEKITEKSNDEVSKVLLRVYVWKDLFCFEKTEKSEMTIKDFSYDKDGIEQGIDFVEGFRI